jgi:shikimate dehydrogenase
MTRIAGVLGRPVAHSLSPLIHDAWIAAAGIDARYEMHDVAPEDFADFIARVRAESRVRGFNVTVPHKAAALACATVVRPAAMRAGAANLLLFQDGEIVADNTDGVGLLSALSEQAGFDPAGKTALVLGAGGAARGAVAALADAGAARVLVVNRTYERARQLQDLDERVRAVILSRSTSAFIDADVVINATTQGLGGGPGPHAPLGMTHTGCVVMDMVYKPLRTQLLIEAARLGRPRSDGLAMLIGQARPSFEAFYGVAPDPAADVRGLALAALGESKAAEVE